MGKQGPADVERRKTILRMVQESGSASVAQLRTTLDVFAATVHRDLAVLTEERAVEWVHGGIPTSTGGADDLHVPGEEAHRCSEETEVARTALSFISPETHSVFLETSTTVTRLGLLLRERRGLVSLTNNPEIALKLVVEGFEVTLVGRQLRARTLTTVGPDVNHQTSLFRIDVVFTGVSVINVDGLSSMNAIETGTKTAIIAASRVVVTLDDHSRPGKRGLAYVARADTINVLVTDAHADDAAVEALRSCRLEAIIVEG